MKNRTLLGRCSRGFGAIVIALLLAMSLLPMRGMPKAGLAPQDAIAAEAAGNLVVLGYTITDKSGDAVAEVHKGDVVNITVHARNTAFITDQVKPEDIDVAKLVDSFSAGEAKAVVTSADTDPLAFDVEMTGLVYSGNGKDIRIMGGIKGNPTSYETEGIEIHEAVANEEPKPADPTPSVIVMPTTEAPSSDAAPSTGSDGSSEAAAPAPSPDPSVPNIIIDRFSFGGGTVAAGSNFTLGFDFRNTGKLGIENIVASIDGGESFTMNNSTNTFFYDSLPSGAVKSQDVPLQALATAKSGAQSVGVTFKYEYVDGSKRTSATSEIKLSVPVSLPDRFQITAPAVPTDITAGNEVVLTLPYVNKGKGEVSNVEAAVEGDGIEAVAKTQYIGNIAAGGSGSIGFALTPTKAGSTKVMLKVSYEDSNLQVKTAEFPVVLKVAEASAQEDALPADMNEEQAGASPWAWLLLPFAIGVGVVVAFALYRRKKKAQQAAVQNEPWEEWREWDEGQYADEPDPESSDSQE